MGEFGGGLPGLWGTSGDSNLVQIPGTGYDGGGQQLEGGGGQLKKGQKSWTLMTRILGWEGVYSRISDLF